MVRNNVWEPPQAIAEIVNEFKVDIGCGVGWFVVILIPKPNWPLLLLPQE